MSIDSSLDLVVVGLLVVGPNGGTADHSLRTDFGQPGALGMVVLAGRAEGARPEHLPVSGRPRFACAVGG